MPEHKAIGGPLKLNFEVLGMQDEINQQTQLKETIKKLGLKCLKNGKNHGAIAFSYPLFLLIIHHEETWHDSNHDPNPNLKGSAKVQ